jgi:hypothetical protein
MQDKKILVVGCSFLYRLNVDNTKIKVIGIPGAGNTLLAEVVLSELSTKKYDRVFVIWTGINRIDLPIGRALADTFDQQYLHKVFIGNTVWYASGGINMSGQGYKCPKIPSSMFDSFYKSSDQRYLTDQGLGGVLKVQSYLQANQIEHQMAFIYDIHNDEYDINWLCNVLGKVDTQSHVYQLIDWDNIQTTNTPYEWAQKCRQLSDEFHPTDSAMIEWIREYFQLDIANLQQ